MLNPPKMSQIIICSWGRTWLSLVLTKTSSFLEGRSDGMGKFECLNCLCSRNAQCLPQATPWRFLLVGASTTFTHKQVTCTQPVTSSKEACRGGGGKVTGSSRKMWILNIRSKKLVADQRSSRACPYHFALMQNTMELAESKNVSAALLKENGALRGCFGFLLFFFTRNGWILFEFKYQKNHWWALLDALVWLFHNSGAAYVLSNQHAVTISAGVMLVSTMLVVNM